MPFTSDGLTQSLAATKNYKVPLYYSYLKTGSFRTNLPIDGKEFRNYALNCNYLSSRVTRWKSPAYFLGPLSNSMTKKANIYNVPPSVYNSAANFFEFCSTKYNQTNLRLSSTQSATNTAQVYIESILMGGVGSGTVIQQETLISYNNPNVAYGIQDIIFISSNSLIGGGQVNTKELVQNDLYASSNFMFTGSENPYIVNNNEWANQYTNVNSFNPASPLLCAPFSESAGIPSLFKTLHYNKIHARKILWTYKQLKDSTNLLNTACGGYATGTSKRNFFVPGGSANYLPKPWVYATAMNITQSSKPVTVFVNAAVGAGATVGRFEISNSLTSAYIDFTSTTATTKRTNMLWPTDSAMVTTGLIAAQLNGSGSLDINLWKPTSPNATLFQVFHIVIDETM